MDRDVSFGHLLKKLRKARDLTQDALAQQADCAVDTIKKIETGLRRPSRQLAEQLADCLGLVDDERAAFLATARSSAPTDLPPARSHDGPEERQRPPSGTVTFLFTDIEGSTQLWEQHPQAMPAALARHDAIVRGAIETHAGVVVKTTGDGAHAAFATAPDALACALAIGRAMETEEWGALGALRVRVVLHTGVAELRDGDYFGSPLNRVARLLAVGHGGQILLSRAIQELVCDTLPHDVVLQDLGTHRLKDLTRPEHIFQVVAPDLPMDFPPLRTLDSRPHNLPAQLTPLIGRQEEVTAVCDRLRRDGMRLLTLSGPGGTGKTRLALQAAAELIETFTDGVFFVDLAPIADPTLFASTIAVTLGVQETSNQPLIERLKAYLRSKQLLLLLDNFEQILEAAPLVEAMLVAAPHLKVLVTSREVLHLYGEHEAIVPPLAVPDPARLPPLERLSQYDAVRLFIERAQAVKSGFTLTNANAPAVAEICVRLDGLPLAIELAAVRCKLFAPEQLLERLKNRLQMLTGGARTLPARQQTLRNAIDWSYTLLQANEQRLFTRLGVFVSGCTLDAAEAVCNTDGELGMDVLDGLVSLIDKSLLKQEELDGELRFTMLETIREYTLERFTASGEVSALRTAHTAYYLALAERAEPHLTSAEQELWLQRLEAEHDNLRAALQSSLIGHAAEQALRLSGALWRFWRICGYHTEGRRWLEAALAMAPVGSSADTETPFVVARARALAGACIMAHYQGDYSRATVFGGESLALSRRLGDRRGIAAALHGLALVARSGENYAAAGAMYGESLAISRELGDVPDIAFALCRIGVVHLFDSKFAAARPVLEESLALYRQLGDQEGTGIAIHSLGYASWGEGDNGTAWRLLSEALEIFRAVGSRRYIAHSFEVLGRVAASDGNATDARTYIEEAVRLHDELGDRLETATGLDALADAAVQLGQPSWAAHLMGAASALYETLGVAQGRSMYRQVYERTFAAARTQLGTPAFAIAWEAGRAMAPAEAIAVQDAEPQQQSAPARHVPAALQEADAAALTARELEVLRLVAQGFTDAQVAERLIISPRTVHGHLRSIYSKLDVTSRTAAVRYAVDNQLL